MRRLHWILFLGLFAGVAQAQGADDAQPGTVFRLMSAQFGAIAAVQDGGFCGSGILRYNPSYRLTERLSVGVSVDFSPQFLEGRTNFASLNSLANVSFDLDATWGVQASAGAQTWTCDGCGTRLATGALASYAIGLPSLPWIKNVWVQYIAAFRDPVVHQLIAGLSIGF